MGVGGFFRGIGHGLEATGKAVAEGAGATAEVLAAGQPTEVVEVDRPLPGPWEIERPEEVVIERPHPEVLVERPAPEVIVERPKPTFHQGGTVKPGGEKLVGERP